MKKIIFMLMLYCSNCWGAEELFLDIKKSIKKLDIPIKDSSSSPGIIDYKEFEEIAIKRFEELEKELNCYNQTTNAIDPQRYEQIIKESIYITSKVEILKKLLSLGCSVKLNAQIHEIFNNDWQIIKQFIRNIIENCEPSNINEKEKIERYEEAKLESTSVLKLMDIAKEICWLQEDSFYKWWNSGWYKDFKETSSLLKEILYRVLNILDIGYVACNVELGSQFNIREEGDSSILLQDQKQVLSSQDICCNIPANYKEPNDINNLINRDEISVVLQKNLSKLEYNTSYESILRFLEGSDMDALLYFFRNAEKENIEKFLDILDSTLISKLPNCNDKNNDFVDYQWMVKFFQIDITKFQLVIKLSTENNFTTNILADLAKCVKIFDNIKKEIRNIRAIKEMQSLNHSIKGGFIIPPPSNICVYSTSCNLANSCTIKTNPYE